MGGLGVSHMNYILQFSVGKGRGGCMCVCVGGVIFLCSTTLTPPLNRAVRLSEVRSACSLSIVRSQIGGDNCCDLFMGGNFTLELYSTF